MIDPSKPSEVFHVRVPTDELPAVRDHMERIGITSKSVYVRHCMRIARELDGYVDRLNVPPDKPRPI